MPEAQGPTIDQLPTPDSQVESNATTQKDVQPQRPAARSFLDLGIQRGNEFWEDITTRRNLTGLAILATLVASGIFAKGQLTGFNSEPRAPHGHDVGIADFPQADRALMCLREAFNDECEGTLWPTNRWATEHCDQNSIADAVEKDSKNPLEMIVSKRDALISNLGLPTDITKWECDVNEGLPSFQPNTAKIRALHERSNARQRQAPNPAPKKEKRRRTNSGPEFQYVQDSFDTFQLPLYERRRK